MAKIKLIRREKESPLARVLVPVASVLMAFAVGWIILALAGHNPVLVYQKLYNGDSTAKTGCLTPMGVFNSKNCLEQIAQKVLFQLKIANLDLHYYGFVFVNLNLGIISLLLAFSASLACPEPSGKTA